jgi:hypothetical protein
LIEKWRIESTNEAANGFRASAQGHYRMNTKQIERSALGKAGSRTVQPEENFCRNEWLDTGPDR